MINGTVLFFYGGILSNDTDISVSDICNHKGWYSNDITLFIL